MTPTSLEGAVCESIWASDLDAKYCEWAVRAILCAISGQAGLRAEHVAFLDLSRIGVP